MTTSACSRVSRRHLDGKRGRPTAAACRRSTAAGALSGEPGALERRHPCRQEAGDETRLDGLLKGLGDADQGGLAPGASEERDADRQPVTFAGGDTDAGVRWLLTVRRLLPAPAYGTRP